MSVLLKIKLTKIILYSLFILAIAVLILAVLNIFVFEQVYMPKESIFIPVDCLQHSESVNKMLDQMGITAVRVLTPQELQEEGKKYIQNVSFENITK